MNDFYVLAVKVFNLDEGSGLQGVVGRPYKDTAGFWTIGRGHLIGESLTDLRLSEYMIDELFKEDLATAIREARLVVGGLFFDSLEDARKIALISMLFTLGRNKFLKFEKAIEAIRMCDWDSVAAEVLNSKWARDVDIKKVPGKGRDDRVAYMFRTGEFPVEYGI
jgi:lysozyme